MVLVLWCLQPRPLGSWGGQQGSGLWRPSEIWPDKGCSWGVPATGRAAGKSLLPLPPPGQQMPALHAHHTSHSILAGQPEQPGQPQLGTYLTRKWRLKDRERHAQGQGHAAVRSEPGPELRSSNCKSTTLATPLQAGDSKGAIEAAGKEPPPTPPPNSLQSLKASAMQQEAWRVVGANHSDLDSSNLGDRDCTRSVLPEQDGPLPIPVPTAGAGDPQCSHGLRQTHALWVSHRSCQMSHPPAPAHTHTGCWAGTGPNPCC